jgi:hypothetical protein
MNAFNNVNIAGACLLTSTEYAKELGIPKSKWIYPLGGAGTRDSSDCKDPWSPPTIPWLKNASDRLGTSEFLLKPGHLEVAGCRVSSVRLGARAD